MKTQKKYIKKALDQKGFKEYTPIQTEVIEDAKKGRDIIGCSQTGSGKTHAFLIPIFERIDEEVKSVQAVITAPTRELSTQIYEMAREIAEHAETQIDIRLYTGGTDRNSEITRLESSQPQIVIGTPGKLHDLVMKERVLEIYNAPILVIDEADMSLESGFLENIDHLASGMHKDLQIMVFSATIPEAIRPFLRKYMKQPKEVYIKPKQLSSLQIQHIFLPVKSRSREQVLFDLLQTFKPYVALLFCNTKNKVDELYPILKQKGYNIAKLHGDITPRERKRIMKRIQNSEYQYIIASDIASRGIDIDGVSHVINVELPNNMEFYIHRTGRTGRAAYDGLAISLYHEDDAHYIDYLEEKGIEIEYRDLKNGELVTRRERKQRFKRKNVHAGFDKHALNIKKKNKKVKPGYKKKYHKKLQREKKKALRRKYRGKK